jgi:hypothetical protein
MIGLFLLVIDVGMFVGTYFHLARGDLALASRLQVVRGSLP